MNKKYILITGYPHTGTSILKSKFGECKNLHEVIDECDFVHQRIISNSGDNEFILLKSPVLPLEIRKHGIGCNFYKNYTVIFVNRNPWYLFTSLIKRGFNPLSGCKNHLDFNYYHTIEEYLVACKVFIDAQTKNYSNAYAIKYEDFFDNDGESIKKIMKEIGLDFDDDIFQKKTKDYSIDSRVHIPNEKPKDLSQNRLYRNWQINQPFQNMNGDVDIPDELSEILENSPIIKQLGYTDPRKIK